MVEKIRHIISNDFMNIHLHEYEMMPNHIHGKNKIPEIPGINGIPVGADSISAHSISAHSKTAHSISAPNMAKMDYIAEMDSRAKMDNTGKMNYTTKGQKWILPLHAGLI